MLRTMLKSKIHRATVTRADLHYVGSITVDQDLIEAADLLPGEQAQVAAELVSPRQRHELLADEARQRLPTGQRLSLGVVDAGAWEQPRLMAFLQAQGLAHRTLRDGEALVRNGAGLELRPAQA